MKSLRVFAIYILIMLLVASPLLLITTAVIDSYAGAPFPVGMVLGTCLFDALMGAWMIRTLRSARSNAELLVPIAKGRTRPQLVPHVEQRESQPAPPTGAQSELLSFTLRIVEVEPVVKHGDKYAA